MSPAAIEQQEESTTTYVVSERSSRFVNLRGVQWRIDLGILPPSSSVDDLRRVTANSRRRYAGLRRRLLVDPHLPKDGSNSPDLVMDNPLSQNPDSTWGRFFRNAELEKMVDQDLSRLYPEHGSYFQTPGCQGMLRRILLLWCLRHPDYGYRQGMHELLAPLLYVLNVDVQRLFQVRKEYEDHFTDKFDGLSFDENDRTYNFDIKKFLDPMEDEIGSHGKPLKLGSLDELDPEIQTIVMLSDAYGAEGELGIVLSEKFMEHDAYCMFDALMSGAHGSVAMADFFAPSVSDRFHTTLPPVIEASAAVYHLLSLVDSSLHSHLVELGVEPQYFGLRWLRVLFGREFSLENLLIIWDEVFASDNTKVNSGDADDAGSGFGILGSPRGALIVAIAVSMMLYLRSSLYATENATSCLQRLLNFQDNINLKKIISKAKSLQTIALDANTSMLSFSESNNRSKSTVVRAQSLSSDIISPRTPLSVVPDSYWEEKWRVLHNAEEQRRSILEKQNSTRKKGWSEKVKLRLSRTESDPSPAKAKSSKKESSSVRRSLLDDLSRQLGLQEDVEKREHREVPNPKDNSSLHDNAGRQDGFNNTLACTSDEVETRGGITKDFTSRSEEVETQDDVSKDLTNRPDEQCLTGNVGSEENSSLFSDPASPVTHDNENDSEKSSVASNSAADENDDHSQTISEDQAPEAEAEAHNNIPQNSQNNHDSSIKSVTGARERKLLLGKFQWLWKFGRNNAGEEISENGEGAVGKTKSADAEDIQGNAGFSTADGSCSSSVSSKGEVADQNVIGSLKNLGHSMLEHIQVIESVFQQDRGQAASLENFSKNVLVGKGQATAMSALKELRKISNLLSEM